MHEARMMMMLDVDEGSLPGALVGFVGKEVVDIQPQLSGYEGYQIRAGREESREVPGSAC